MRRALLLVLLALAAAGCATPRRLRPFTTDGCSAFPDQGLGQRQDWHDCCVAHDMAYWHGGGAEERAAADLALRRCVEARTGSPALAETMYLGVRAGGSALFPTSFRWGYGWRFDHPNAPLDEVEREIADQEMDRWLRANPEAPTPPWREGAVRGMTAP